MKVIVCGGRHYRNCEHVEWVLAKVGATVIIEPGNLGAAHYASEWAKRKGFELRTVRMRSREHGLQAGPIRNREMLQERPDLVIVFSGNDYVADIVSQAREDGIDVLMAETIGPAEPVPEPDSAEQALAVDLPREFETGGQDPESAAQVGGGEAAGTVHDRSDGIGPDEGTKGEQ
jgi:hypothetical protein